MDWLSDMHLKPILVGLAGVGTVGSGVATLLKRNLQEIERRLGRSIILYAASDHHAKAARSIVGNEVIFVENVFDLLNYPEIDVIIELMGGTTVAQEFVLEAIKRGKHVVTANKALLAKEGTAIFQAAQKKDVMIGFEASVAGGIPIIKALKEGLSANRVESVCGIINGTSNYILTAMRNQKSCFHEALSDAQQLGYAESDPTSDIEGFDAGYKLTILASVAFGVPICFDACYIEGISALSSIDMDYAEELGYKIKSLGLTKRVGDQIELRVHPTLIPANQLIANVDGVINAVLVSSDMVGKTLYYGPGAGALPTASAVVADLIDIARLLNVLALNRVPYTGFQPSAIEALSILPIQDIFSAYYLRIKVTNRMGVLGDITHLLAKNGISIEAVIQKSAVAEEDIAQIVVLTNLVQEHLINIAIRAIEALPIVVDRVVRLRVESFK